MVFMISARSSFHALPRRFWLSGIVESRFFDSPLLHLFASQRIRHVFPNLWCLVWRSFVFLSVSTPDMFVHPVVCPPQQWSFETCPRIWQFWLHHHTEVVSSKSISSPPSGRSLIKVCVLRTWSPSGSFTVPSATGNMNFSPFSGVSTSFALSFLAWSSDASISSNSSMSATIMSPFQILAACKA